MIIDQLFEDDKKKKLNEVDPRNFDSDEDYYAAVRGKRSSSDDDYDYEPEDDIDDMDDDESYYEKYVRTKNLEGYETTPFGSVNDQRPQMPAVPQQDREAQEQARERQARISDFREKKRDLLQQFAQLGTLRTEMIHGLDNDVFLNKDQLIDFFEQQIDDPSLTALEYAYENNIPTDGLIRNILRRATQLGVSMLDVRKMFNQAKQKLGENIGRKVDAKGLTQGEWMQAVKQKFPDAKIVQAKMIDGPAHALLSDGRKIVWNPVQGVAEGYDTAEDYRAKAEWLRRELHLSPDEAWERAYDTDPDSWVGTPWEHDYKQGVAEVGQNFRRGNARRAALNAMSPEELKAHEEKRAEQQRKRDETRLERERQRNAAKKGVAEGRQRKLNEAMLMEDPVYRNFKRVGQFIVERELNRDQVLDMFAQVEAGMTDKATGANRTALGRGKDKVAKFAGDVSGAVKGILNGMKESAPMQAVEVAYDQATDALANVAGGQQGPVMQAIKKYRLLAKQYPKTAGLVKSALIAVAGMASSGVAPIAIIGMLGTLDRALKGNTLFDSLVGGAGDTALAGVSQAVSHAVAGAMAPDATLTQPGNAGAHDMDMMSNMGDVDAMGNPIVPNTQFQQTYGDNGYGGPEAAADTATQTGEVPADTSLAPGEEIVPPGAEGFGGGTYTVQDGDQGGYIAQAMGISYPDLKALNPQITNWDKLPIGTELQLPPANTHTGSVWDGSATGAPATPTPAAPTAPAPTAPSTTAAAPATGGRVEQYIPQPNGTWIDASTGQVADPAKLQASQNAVRNALFRTPISSQGFKESINFKVIPAEQMIDQKLTVLNWALLESVNRKSNSISLTTKGVYTVFENVDRYRRAILEATDVAQGPGYNRLDMPNAPVTPDANPGMIGKGLNWLDKTAGKVGSWLGNKAHQLTTGITKDKLKIKWQQDGEPLDSDQLATWLVSKGVPQQVVSDVYGKMGIPYTAPARAYKGMGDPTGAVNLATGVPYTGDQLKAMTNTAKTAKDVAADPAMAAKMNLNRQGLEATAAAELGPQATTSVAPTAAPAQTAAPAPAATAATTAGQPYNVTYGKGFNFNKPAAKPAAPNFARKSEYKNGTPAATSFNIPPAAKPAAPATKTTATPQLSKDEYIKRIGADATAESKQPVAETVKQVKRMMETVTTKADVQRVKDYIDRHMGTNLTESARLKRNRLISEVTQLAATRRREIARQMAQ